MANDLLASLQRLGDAEHDDLSVAHDALAEIVNLRAEVERLRADADAYMKIANDTANDVLHMEADAARYLYLRDDCDGFEITVREEDEDGWETWVSGYPPDELDIAIDNAIAAMEASNGS